jgi:hypothetical protein
MRTETNTTLLLIDNDCSDLNIKNIAQILTDNFNPTAPFIELNGTKLRGEFIGSHLPIATSAKYLKLADFSWPSMRSYAHVVFLTDKSGLGKQLIIFALYYRILTGNTISLITNNQLTICSLFNFYPFFLHIYSAADDCESFKMPEIAAPSNLAELKTRLQAHLIQKIEAKSSNVLNDATPLLNEFFAYAIHASSMDLFDGSEYNKAGVTDLLKSACFKLNEAITNKEFLYYDSQFNTKPSLFTNTSVSLPGPGETRVHVFTAPPADYQFRNLVFRDVFMNLKNSSTSETFVLPHYEDEQSTRQTIRFLIMKLYNVFNNSAQVDLIVLYLFIKVAGSISEANREQFSFVRTKYENMARVFMKRHGKTPKSHQKFLEDNRELVLKLREYFAELRAYEDDDDLYELFDDFVSLDFKLKTPLNCVYEIATFTDKNGTIDSTR